MRTKITANTAAKITPAPDRDLFIWDERIPGFGLRVKPSGIKTWVVQVKVGGKTRRKALGRVGLMGLQEARQEARQQVRQQQEAAKADYQQRQANSHQQDQQQQEARAQARKFHPSHQGPPATVSKLARIYLEDYAPARELSAEYLRHIRHVIDRHILPEIGNHPVSQVSRHDIAAILRPLRNTRYQHNRARSVLAKLFNLAIDESTRADNPVAGIPRLREQPRARYLSQEELSRLSRVLNEEPDQDSADIIRFLLLTGARKGEALNTTWQQLDLQERIWTKPASGTKQRRIHRVPLSQAAVALLRRRWEAAKLTSQQETSRSDGRKRRHSSEKSDTAPPEKSASADASLEKSATPPELSGFVFPGRDTPSRPRENLKRVWESIRRRAGLQDVRIHDLRHTYASVMVSQGYSLAVIGRLLGHSETSTTARYAHLQDETLRQATEGVSGLLVGGASQLPVGEG